MSWVTIKTLHKPLMIKFNCIFSFFNDIMFQICVCWGCYEYTYVSWKWVWLPRGRVGYAFTFLDDFHRSDSCCALPVAGQSQRSPRRCSRAWSVSSSCCPLPSRPWHGPLPSCTVPVRSSRPQPQPRRNSTTKHTKNNTVLGQSTHQ